MDGWNCSSPQFCAAPYCHAVAIFLPPFVCNMNMSRVFRVTFFFPLLQVLRCLFRHDARLCKQHTDDWWWHSHRWCESCPNKNPQQFGEEVKDNQGLLNIGSLVQLFLFASTKMFGCFYLSSLSSLANTTLNILDVFWFFLVLLCFRSFCSDVHATPCNSFAGFIRKKITPHLWALVPSKYWLYHQ